MTAWGVSYVRIIKSIQYHSATVVLWWPPYSMHTIARSEERYIIMPHPREPQDINWITAVASSFSVQMSPSSAPALLAYFEFQKRRETFRQMK